MIDPALKKQFTVVAWSYHHGQDFCVDHPDRDRFWDATAAMGFDAVIDYHNAADLAAERGLKLIIMASVSPDDPDKPMGEVHWGLPAVDGGPSVYGNVAQLAWYEKNFGTHPAVIGYCLNDSCAPCPENDTAARWLMENAPDKLRYVSHNAPRRQDPKLYPIISFLNFAFASDERPGRSRSECFRKVAATAAGQTARNGHELFWPIIPGRCPNREVTADELKFQIEELQAAGADGVVVFPWSPRYKTYQTIGTTLSAHLTAAKARRKAQDLTS